MANAGILIVEDQQVIAEEIKRRLMNLGYSVLGIACCGEEAVALVDRVVPDLVLMDIVIEGGMDGVETADRIQSRHDIPVVYLTAHADDATLRRARLTGPLGYLIKPFREKELHATVETALYTHELILERKRAEEELRTYREHLEELVLERTIHLREANDQLVQEKLRFQAISEQASRQSKLLEAINRLLRESMHAETAEDLARAFLVVGTGLTGSRFGFAGEFTRSGAFRTFEVTSRRAGSATLPLHIAIRLAREIENTGILREIAEKGRSRIVNRPPQWTDQPWPFAALPEISSFMGVPLKRRGRLVGLVGLVNKKTGYTDIDKENGEALSVVFAETLHRKHTELALKESREMFSLFMDHLPAAAFIKDTGGNDLYRNRHMKGLAAGSLHSIFQNGEVAQPREAARPSVEHIEEVALQKSVYEVHRFPIVFPGNPVLRGGIAIDITERKKAEEDLQGSVEKMRQILEQTASALASALEKKDPYTAGHQERVSLLASAIAKELDLLGHQIEGLRVAGILHDIGKIYVPSEILSKPGKLSVPELGLVKSHVEAGYDILRNVEFPWPLARIVLQHHERLDGSGYPQGLSGADIMLEAKILAIADVVEAMSSHRPYRPSKGVVPALQEIETNKGTLYDPAAVEACARLFNERGFSFERGSGC